MKNIFLLIFSATTISVAQAEVIFNKPQKGEVQISTEIQKILQKWDTDFRVYPLKSFPPTVIGLFRDEKNELPMAVAGDFNGDQKQDFALMGNNKTQQKVVILLKQETGYVLVLVHTQAYTDPQKSFINTEETGKEKGLSLYLSLLPAKDIEISKKSTFANKPDALQMENYGGATSAYYLKPAAKNKFEVKEYKGMIDE